MSHKSICTNRKWRGRPDCTHCAVRKSVLFAGLEESDLSGLLSSVDNYQYDPGSILCRNGEPATSLHSLRKGVVKFEAFDENGQIEILRLLGPGAVIGLETTLDEGRPYHCTATALSTVDACRIPLGVFKRLMKEHPEHYKVILGLWKHHLEAADEALLNFRRGELRERLLHTMKVLSRFADDGCSFHLPSGKDLSALTGATPVAISRIMAEFKRQGVLSHVTDSRYCMETEKD